MTAGPPLYIHPFRWRASGQTRLVVLASGIGLSVALAGQSPGIYILIAVIAVVGLFVSPILITAYLTVEEAAAPGTRTEGGTWVNTAHNLGNSAGTAGIGLLVDRFPLPACFAAAALPALLPAIAVAIGKKSGRSWSPHLNKAMKWICGSSAVRMARANADAHGASGLGGSDGGVGKFGGGAS